MGAGSVCVRILCQIRGDRRLPKGAVLTCGRSVVFHPINGCIPALQLRQCAGSVPLLRAKEGSLWLAKLVRSSTNSSKVRLVSEAQRDQQSPTIVTITDSKRRFRSC